MKVKTTDGREVDLKQDLLDGLKMRMRGSLLLPGEPGYEDSRTVWNGMIDRRPAAVARCLGTADVIECVKLAVANDLLLCIKGGGHNIAGLACADGGLMLDLSPMRGVWVDTRRKIAHAQHAGGRLAPCPPLAVSRWLCCRAHYQYWAVVGFGDSCRFRGAGNRRARRRTG